MKVNIQEIRSAMARHTDGVIFNCSEAAITLLDGTAIAPGGSSPLAGGQVEIVLAPGASVANHYNNNGPDYWILSWGSFPFCAGRDGWKACLIRAVRFLDEQAIKQSEIAAAKAARNTAEELFRVISAMPALTVITHKPEDIFICGPNSYNNIPGSYEVAGKFYKWWESAQWASRKGQRVEVAHLLRRQPAEVRRHFRAVARWTAYRREIRYIVSLAPLAPGEDGRYGYLPAWEHPYERPLTSEWSEKAPALISYVGGEFEAYAKSFKQLLQSWLGAVWEIRS